MKTKTKIQPDNEFRDTFLHLAIAGVLWILLWIPMVYFTSEYGGRVISTAEYGTVIDMALKQSGESAVTSAEVRVINQMASAPLVK